jgi:hypothetical protein
MLRVLEVAPDNFHGANVSAPLASVKNFGVAVTVSVLEAPTRAQVLQLPGLESCDACVLRFCADNKRDSLMWLQAFRALL